MNAGLDLNQAARTGMRLSVVVKLQRHGAVCGCATGAQGGCDQRAFCDFFARGSGSLGGLGMYFDAVRTLGGESYSQCNQLAVFSRNSSAVAADDFVKIQPGVEFSGSKFAHLLQQP